MCADSNCPNKEVIEKLKRENADLRRQVEELQKLYVINIKEHSIGTKARRRF